MIVCDPKRDLYVTTTGGCTEQENQRLLRIITETIIAEAQQGPIPYEDAEYHSLEKRLSELCLPVADGEPDCAREREYFSQTYLFADNRTGITSIAFERTAQDELGIRMVFRGVPVEVHAGYKRWITSEAPLDTPEHTIHSFTYGWGSRECLTIKQYMCNSSYYKIYQFTFSDQSVEFCIDQNVSLYGDKPERVKSICRQ